MIEDQGEKQVEALKNLKDLKPKEQTRAIEGKFDNNQELQLYLMISLKRQRA